MFIFSDLKWLGIPDDDAQRPRTAQLSCPDQHFGLFTQLSAARSG
jgi:hypothetical protein